MGRPKDRIELELRRAHDELAKGLQRRDGERAAQALVQLPKADRLAALAAVMPLFAGQVQRAQAAHDHGQLAQLAELAAQEPGLLDARPGPAWQEQRWALLWGAALRRDWALAGRFLDDLRPDLQVRSAALLAWLTAWVQGRGEIAEAALLPALPAPDKRLGYERPVRTPPPALPTAPEQVEAAVFSAAVTQRPIDFRALLISWARSLSAPLAQQVRVLGGKLALYEALRAAPERRHLAPLSLLAALAGELAAPGAAGLAAGSQNAPLKALAAEALVGLRLLTSYRGSVLTEEESRTLVPLALAAAQNPEQRSVVSAYVARLQFPATAYARAQELYEKLLAIQPEPQLWARAVEHWITADIPADGPPSFLAKTLTRLLAGSDLASGHWLRQLVPPEKGAIWDFLASEVPAALGLDLVDRGWAGADPELRHHLAELVVELIELALGSQAQLIRQVRTVGDYLSLAKRLNLDDPLELEVTMRELPRQLPIPESLRAALLRTLRETHRGREVAYTPQQQAELQRFAVRLVPISQRFVELAMRAAHSPEEAIGQARAYIDHATKIEAALPLVRYAAQNISPAVAMSVISYTVSRWQNDAPALARALLKLQRQSAPPSVCSPFAQALLRADPGFSGVRELEYQAALKSALRLVPARERKKLGLSQPSKAAKSVKRPSSRKPPAAAEPRQRRTSRQPGPSAGGRQIELPEALR